MSKTSTKGMINLRNENTNGAHDDKNEFNMEPGNNVISNILNFSKALSIIRLKNDEFVELVLN